MASNPSIFPQIGMEGTNTGYFMAGNNILGCGGMRGADVTPFYPSTLLEYASLGLASLGGVTVAELGEQFAANNVASSFADHLPGARPLDEHLGPGTPPEPDDMDCGFDVVGGGGSCSAASLGGAAVWSRYGRWSGVSDDRSRTAIWAHEPYHLAGFPDTAGFHFPVATCGGGDGGPSAPATSELSLTLCSKSKSSSGSVPMNAADQRSSVAISRRSAPTEPPFAVAVARYAAATQEVLNDFVGRLLDGVADVDAADSGIDSGGARPSSWSVVDAPSSVVSSDRLVVGSSYSEDGGARSGEAQRAQSDFLKMLQMLDQKYNQCLDEVQSTVAKFNDVLVPGGGGRGGLGNANSSICAPFAHRAVSAMYRGLKRRITGEIVAASRPSRFGEPSSSATTAGGDVERCLESAIIQKHWAAQQKAREPQQCWRPHRGLPERSVAVLKGWMFEHFLKPYPDDHEKEMLAARSGLTRSQVSNWFINARVRIWKPMIEAMYQDLKRASSSAGKHGTEEMEPVQNVSRATCCQLLEDYPETAQLQ